MATVDYEHFYNRVGRENGWDFSKLRVSTEGVDWDFYDEVCKISATTDVLLDIGTGGGENILNLANSLFFLIGIDLSKGMLETAHANLKQSKASNVKFFQMSSDNLQFPGGFFDIVSSRHAPFDAMEVAKVLKKDGWFLTQQVSEADKLNLKQAFNRGQGFNQKDGQLKDQYVNDLKAAGFSQIETYEYDATEYYERPEDLIFLLKHTPIIPRFGEEKEDLERLEDFIKMNTSEKGIQTNSKRFLIIAKK